MFRRTVKHRDLQATRLIALWFTILAICFVSPVNADVIDATELISAQHAASWEYAKFPFFDWTFHKLASEDGACGGSAASEQGPGNQTFPELLPESATPETLFTHMGSNGASGGAGTSPTSSVVSSYSTSGAAILCWRSDLSEPLLVGRSCAIEDLRIPPAPPFEMLRPPRLNG